MQSCSHQQSTQNRHRRLENVFPYQENYGAKTFHNIPLTQISGIFGPQDSSLISFAFILKVIQTFFNNQLRSLSTTYGLNVVSSRSLRRSSSASFLLHLKCPTLDIFVLGIEPYPRKQSATGLPLFSGAWTAYGAHLTSCNVGNGRAFHERSCHVLKLPISKIWCPR